MTCSTALTTVVMQTTDIYNIFLEHVPDTRLNSRSRSLINIYFIIHTLEYQYILALKYTPREMSELRIS